jgi:phosphatidylglycerol---prolipoprotein diacylglyceryl transferase
MIAVSLASFVNGHWVHDLSPFLGPHWGNIGIRYYGLAYLLGFAGAWWLLGKYFRAGRSPFDGTAVSDLMTYLVIGVLVGGRLGYFLLYQPAALLREPLAIVRVWDGGMASHGGFVGVLLVLWWWARRRAVPLFQITDLVVSVAPVGLFFGRVANFINGELWGKPAQVAWAVIFPQSEAPGVREAAMVPRHPSQLYEAALEGLLLFAVMQWRFWRGDVVGKNPGRLSGEFLAVYAVVRIFGELFREPDASLILGVSRGIFYSVVMIVAGAILVVRRSRAAA